MQKWRYRSFRCEHGFARHITCPICPPPPKPIREPNKQKYPPGYSICGVEVMENLTGGRIRAKCRCGLVCTFSRWTFNRKVERNEPPLCSGCIQ